MVGSWVKSEVADFFCIFTESFHAYFKGQVRLSMGCSAGDRNRRKANMNIQKNPATFTHDPSDLMKR